MKSQPKKIVERYLTEEQRYIVLEKLSIMNDEQFIRWDKKFSPVELKDTMIGRLILRRRKHVQKLKEGA